MGCNIYYEFLIDTPYEVKAIIPFLVKNFIMNKLNFVKGFFFPVSMEIIVLFPLFLMQSIYINSFCNHKPTWYSWDEVYIP